MGSTPISQIPSRALRTLGDDGLGHGASNGIVPTIGEVGLGCSGGSELDSTGVPFPILAPEQIANLYYPVLLWRCAGARHEEPGAVLESHGRLAVR